MRETTQERELRKLREGVQNLTKAVSTLTRTIEKATPGPDAAPPTPDEIPVSLGSQKLAAQVAVATLQGICKEAADCSKDGCLLHDWCSEQLPDARPAKAPQHWPLP